MERNFCSIQFNPEKAKTISTVTGTPPLPVVFSFSSKTGNMIDLTGKAGFRTVEVKAWLEDTPQPGRTKLRVLFDPETLGTKTGDIDIRYQLRTILERTDEQFLPGQRIEALFGKAPATH